MWEPDHKESWAPKNWYFWTMVLEKILESPLDSKKIKPVNPKENQPWILIGRADAEAPILWPPDAKSPNHWKRLWIWESLKAGGEGGDSGWDGWMASLIQWTWTWANSRWWQGTGRSGVLQSIGLQSRTWPGDWTTNTCMLSIYVIFISVQIFCQLLTTLS